MSGVVYQVKGLDKFLSNLDKKPKKLQQSVAKELNRSSLRVEGRAKEMAPWDTGWLAMNIYSHKVDTLTYEVISPVEYSVYQEFGTRFMNAQPYMFPAMQEEYPILMSRLGKIVGV